MLRIGLMLDSFSVDAWIAKLIDDIQASDFATVSLIILNTPQERPRLSLRKRIKAHWQKTAYVRYSEWDYHRNRGADDSHAQVDLSEKLARVQVLQVKPLRKGFTDRLEAADVEAVRAADLDVMFRFGFRIVRGEILDAARYGVWSFHHDDNLEYRGGPPLFWEIYEENPVSGTILQRLTDSLDGGRVLYRGHSSTNLASLYLNRNPIYWKTAEYALRRLRELDRHGYQFIESLPTYNEPNNYSRGIYRAPHTAQMAAFMARKVGRGLRGRWRHAMGRVRPQWFFAIRKRSAENRYDSAKGYAIVRPPQDRFYADPFLFVRDGKTFLFFEDFRYADERAMISCAELDSDGRLGEIFEVVRRPYHLSYPFVFEHEGEIYLIPESLENQTVELYRAHNFPHDWKLESVLLEGIHAVDATIFQRDGKWWMFAGISNGKYSNNDELGIFYAADLKEPWIAHPKNPVVSDVRRARPAGALFYDGDKLIRPSQDCGKAYGYALNFSEVLVLNEHEYEERIIGRIEPGWVKGNLGTHTYTHTDHFEVIDGNFAANPRR